MGQGGEPPGAGAAATLGSVAREVVGAAGGGRFERDGFTLGTLFQPIYSVERGQWIGDEALLRVTDAGGEAVATRDLLAAEDAVGKTRLDWTSRVLHLRNYAVVDPGDRRVFLNVHPAALIEESDGGEEFAQLVRFYGLAPGRVVLEILEADCDERRLGLAVDAYRERGFVVAIDHVGEGRSNFDRIVRLRPRLVKVDRALILHALGESKTRRMLPGFIDLLKQTGAEVVVNSVGNSDEALAAIEAGADYLQGHYLGAPRRLLHDDSLPTELLRSARRLALSA